MAIQMNDVLTSKDQIVSLIDQLSKDGKTRAERMHLAAVSCMHHAHLHGDLTLLSRMINAFGPTENVQEFKYWVAKFSTVTVEDEKDGSEKEVRLIKFDRESNQFKQANEAYPVKGNLDVTLEVEDKYKDENGEWQVVEVSAIETSWHELGKVRGQRSKEFVPDKDVKSVGNYLRNHAKQAEDAGQFELAQVYLNLATDVQRHYDNAMMLARRRQQPIMEAENQARDMGMMQH